MSKLSTERYLAVDSLRGIAALAVTFFHLHHQAFKGVNSEIIAFLSAVLQYGYLGVPVFFVISGFVIAATITAPDVTFRYVGKFAIKRSLRLDPPYWLSIALEISLVYITLGVFGIDVKIPSLEQITANLFYLQNLVGVGDIAANYWTLCLEVQFYLFLALVFAGANKIPTSRARRNFTVSMFVVTGSVSLLIAAKVISNPVPGLFLSHWYLFLLGSTCYWVSIKRSIDKSVFFSYCVLAMTVFVWRSRENHYDALNTLVAIATAIFLYVAAKRQKMSTWLSSRVLLYLGSISYSLYLFHAIIGDRFLSFVNRVLLPRFGISIQSTPMALLLLVLVLAVALISAHLIHALVEKPSVRLSKRVRPAACSSILDDLRGARGDDVEGPPRISPRSAAE